MEQVQATRQTFTGPIPQQPTPMRRTELLALVERDWSEPTFESGDVVLLIWIDDALYEALEQIARRNGVEFQVQGTYLIAYKR